MVSKAGNGVGVAPFGDEYDLAGVGVGRQGQIVMATLVGGLVERHCVNRG
jgi:hypothetical protein